MHCIGSLPQVRPPKVKGSRPTQVFSEGVKQMKQTITGYDFNYKISDSGCVLKDNNEIPQSNNGLGYMFVRLMQNGKRKNKYVHRLVYETFVGKIPKGFEINHINHNKSDNRLCNLELVSHSENVRKAFIKHGYFGFLKKHIK